jgi:hypothetical protein
MSKLLVVLDWVEKINKSLFPLKEKPKKTEEVFNSIKCFETSQ